MIARRQVTPEDLDKRAKELGVMSIETSARVGHNVKTLFKKIAMALPGGNADATEGTVNQSMSTFHVTHHAWMRRLEWTDNVQRSMYPQHPGRRHRRLPDVLAERRSWRRVAAYDHDGDVKLLHGQRDKP